MAVFWGVGHVFAGITTDAQVAEDLDYDGVSRTVDKHGTGLSEGSMCRCSSESMQELVRLSELEEATKHIKVELVPPVVETMVIGVKFTVDGKPMFTLEEVHKRGKTGLCLLSTHDYAARQEIILALDAAKNWLDKEGRDNE